MKTNTTKLRWLARSVLVALAVGSPAAGQKKMPTDTKMKELQALEQRRKSLANKIESDDWKLLLRDFERWAKDHGVSSETRSSAAQSKCRPDLEGAGPRYHCILDTSRTTAAKCVYRCYRI